MAKQKTVFYCTACGTETPKWMGRCPGCGAYNTMEEHIEKPVAAGKAKSAPVGMSRKPQRIRQVTSDDEIRFFTGMGELDRVLGGGAVAGSLVLVGGAPGIGKSTLLLQICDQQVGQLQNDLLVRGISAFPVVHKNRSCFIAVFSPYQSLPIQR